MDLKLAANVTVTNYALLLQLHDKTPSSVGVDCQHHTLQMPGHHRVIRQLWRKSACTNASAAGRRAVDSLARTQTDGATNVKLLPVRLGSSRRLRRGFKNTEVSCSDVQQMGLS